MLPLFDMLEKAQNGEAFKAIARQFELSQKQAQAAVEALMPAFSEGLRRNAADPYGLGSFLAALSTGQHQKYFEDVQRAFTPAGISEGEGILKHLFAYPEVSRAVAEQAAAATGLARQVLEQMLPGLAAIIMGGLYKQSSGQLAGGGFPGGNPYGAMVEQMMRQGAEMAAAMGMPAARSGQAGSVFDNPFTRMMQDYAAAAGKKKDGKAQDAGEVWQAMAQNPFIRMFEQMTGTSRPEPEPQNPSGRPRTPYDDLFGSMFEAGARHQDEYGREMSAIFDRFWKGIVAQS